ncbi:hydantoinase protein [Diplodia corticola]|uniref:Hydantoinase protein n=1 Tax=Diplodia corticola TaxID=236234 RepID=A0A1J9RU91_9PEZI|nr:hydantoinase protein [Diplodia corticola]OJD31999.1 hydantoinase protein [Diplodia corticola]
MAVKRLRIGVDVGGTNTDGVILDPLRASEPDKGILAWHKAPTTTNPSLGIRDALVSMFEQSKINPDEVASVTIGTTHFVNAVIERDAARLSRVAVIRLSGPFGKHAPPCIDWPTDLRSLVLGHHAQVKGGLEVDGRPISDIDEQELASVCADIAAVSHPRSIAAVVINGVFSPIDNDDPTRNQEARAAAIARRCLPPAVDVVCAREVVPQLGFLERENGAVLNAAILAFARRTIRSFREPVRKLGLRCPVFITQNDGTILSGEAAARLPIRTFSSGPTNSMRGAAFLVAGDGGGEQSKKEPMMVVDVGGTTTDVGLLLANGFPRQAAAFSEFAGVRMNFSCPDVKSIGLGGGSIVRRSPTNANTLTVGPDSVGYAIQTSALCFGGTVPTATDYTLAANPTLSLSSACTHAAAARAAIPPAAASSFTAAVRRKLEAIIDTMKTSPAAIPVVLVGGGAVIAPESLRGAARVVRPRHAGVANAVGAAMAGVSAVVDAVRSTAADAAAAGGKKKGAREWVAELEAEAVERAVRAGARRDGCRVVEVDVLPLQYVADLSRFVVRAAGEFDYGRGEEEGIEGVGGEGEGEGVVVERDGVEDVDEDDGSLMEEYGKGKGGVGDGDGVVKEREVAEQADRDFDFEAYRPKVEDRVWYISETDLAWISTGCYILGTGGGGSPYSSMLRLRTMLRNGAVVKVVSPTDLKDDDRVGCGGGAGSPTVGIEKLAGDEMMEAQEELYGLVKDKATHMIALEIGGGNGLQGMILGASTNMDIPTVDGDWMGRAYPTKWQTTPVVFAERKTVWSPTTMCDGNGNVVFMTKATSDETVERVFRAGLSELGSHVGCAEGPVTGAETKRWVVEHTISLSWRIGRAVHKARHSNRIDTVAESIVAEVGGSGAAKVLFKGKIVGVERTLRNGHVYGEVVIEATRNSTAEEDDDDEVKKEGEERFEGTVRIPFKNENIAAFKVVEEEEEEHGGRRRSEETLAIVPDLISCIDAQNGEAIGTPEYRYGLLVVVLGITASDRWTSTPRGVELGGPKAFGLDDLVYKPIGRFEKPRSVIEEYGQ